MSSLIRVLMLSLIMAAGVGCGGGYGDDYDYGYDSDSGDSSGGSYDYTFTCDTGRSSTVPIPSGSCESEYKRYAQVFGCNQVDNMNSAACALESCTGSNFACGGY